MVDGRAQRIAPGEWDEMGRDAAQAAACHAALRAARESGYRKRILKRTCDVFLACVMVNSRQMGLTLPGFRPFHCSPKPSIDCLFMNLL